MKIPLITFTFTMLAMLAACGGNEDDDYKSCSTIAGKKYCCSTKCNAAGNDCKTTCDK